MAGVRGRCPHGYQVVAVVAAQPVALVAVAEQADEELMPRPGPVMVEVVVWALASASRVPHGPVAHPATGHLRTQRRPQVWSGAARVGASSRRWSAGLARLGPPAQPSTVAAVELYGKDQRQRRPSP